MVKQQVLIQQVIKGGVKLVTLINWAALLVSRENPPLTLTFKVLTGKSIIKTNVGIPGGTALPDQVRCCPGKVMTLTLDFWRAGLDAHWLRGRGGSEGAACC